MRQQDMRPELQKELERIRAENRRLVLWGTDAGHVQALVKEEMLVVANRAGVTVGKRGPCFAAARELSRLARTGEGPGLMTEIEIWLRKWTALGLDPLVLQDVVLACLRKFGGPSAIPGVRLKLPRQKRKRRTYEQTIRAGLARAGADVERQLKEHGEAAQRSREVSAIVRRVLGEHNAPGKSFVRYNAFASQVDRRHRRYGGKSLDMAVADLIDIAEAKGLDRSVLLVLSREVLKLPRPKQPATGT